MLKLSRQIPEIANKFVLLTVSDCKFAAAAAVACCFKMENDSKQNSTRKVEKRRRFSFRFSDIPSPFLSD